MNKCYQFLALQLFWFLLCACSNNPLVGTWQQTMSEENTDLNVAVGLIQTFTYESNGDYHSNLELQGHIGDGNAVVGAEVFGTWEMIDDSHVKVKTTSCKISGIEKELEEKTERTFTILSINDEQLEIMENGKRDTFKRIR